MVKNIKQYSGCYGCERCNQTGVKRIMYQEVDTIVLRMNQSFRRLAQEEHHHGYSPFCDLPINMIDIFSIDYMHQACLGVMKHLLLIWLRGEKAAKMSAGQVEEVSRRLINLQKCIPFCFVRKPRDLRQLDWWKETDLHQFLLYTGKLVLIRILRHDLYEHFVTFSVAMSILVCPTLAEQHATYANDLLKYLVAKGRALYGPDFLVYNVHTMLQIASDVEQASTNVVPFHSNFF